MPIAARRAIGAMGTSSGEGAHERPSTVAANEGGDVEAVVIRRAQVACHSAFYLAVCTSSLEDGDREYTFFARMMK